MPKFKDSASWQQAELLMQPAFIRLVDNIRKQLEQSVWVGSYTDVPLFPDGTSDEVKFKVTQLQAELATATPDRSLEIEQALAELPTPFPGYQLCLKHQEQEVTVDVWDLCYQICFRNFPNSSHLSSVTEAPKEKEVEVDTTLFDAVGEVDWNRLDDKTRQVVERVFAELPQ